MSKVVVLFEVKPKEEGVDRYLELAKMLKPILKGFDGFIRAERFKSLSEENKLLSMSIWESEDAVVRWKSVVEHRMCQEEGLNKLFESYKITVASTIREYTDRESALRK